MILQRVVSLLLDAAATSSIARTAAAAHAAAVKSGHAADVFLSNHLIVSYATSGRLPLALRVFDEMRAAGVAPDAPTKALLVKSLWREGKLREAAMVEERCEEAPGGLPEASPGHVWTASDSDLNKVIDIYAGCFAQPAAQAGTG